jgi:aerobic-type carbon monoxide dehydrogenase small subunit (CoxS/CutS family)
MDLNINDKIYKVDAGDDESLLTVLRDDLDLTGSKYGCGEGACGACTVLINGTPTRSCITRIGTLRGAKVVSIEGIEKNAKLHPVQEACLNVDVFQCSYCASGMIMSAVALLNRTKKPQKMKSARRCKATFAVVAHTLVLWMQLSKQAKYENARSRTYNECHAP